jgi:hypothetical protein
MRMYLLFLPMKSGSVGRPLAPPPLNADSSALGSIMLCSAFPRFLPQLPPIQKSFRFLSKEW